MNFILQAKSNVGKTFIASILAEYFHSNCNEFQAFDTYNKGNSFTEFRGVEVKLLELSDKNRYFIPSVFGTFWADSINCANDIIIDIVADLFEPLVKHFNKCISENLNTDSNKVMIVHTVIAGGDKLDDTINGLVTLCNRLPPNIKILVWLNEYFGPIEVDGKPFQEFKIYDNNREKIHGIIKIRAPESEFFKADLNKKNEQKLTFEEAINSDEFSVASKHRLRIIQHELFEQLNEFLSPFLTPKISQKVVDFGTEEPAQTPSENEPIIATQIYNDEVVAKYIDAINSSFETNLNKLSAANTLQKSEANKQAEILVTQAAEYITKQMHQAADELAASTLKLIVSQTSEANKSAMIAKKSRDVAIIAASTAVAFLIIGVVGKLFL